MTEYKTTREQCQQNISGVCPHCGGTVEPIETVDNAKNPTFWSGCMKCLKFCSGVDPKVFQAARKLVTEYHFRPYSFIEEGEPEFLESQTGGTTSMILSVLRVAKEVGLLPHTGS